VEIKRESVTMATVTFQNYFRMYEKLAGMTGTAATEAEEFSKIYELDVIVIPTNEPTVRKDRIAAQVLFGFDGVSPWFVSYPIANVNESPTSDVSFRYQMFAPVVSIGGGSADAIESEKND